MPLPVPLRARQDEAVEAEPSFADPPLYSGASVNSGPVDTRPDTGPYRRLQVARAARDGVVRANPGQLPTFERAFIVRELRQIAMTSTALLGLIIVLTILLR